MSASSSSVEPVKVTLPGEMFDVTPAAARVLLAILIELSEVQLLDRTEGAEHDG